MIESNDVNSLPLGDLQFFSRLWNMGFGDVLFLLFIFQPAKAVISFFQYIVGRIVRYILANVYSICMKLNVALL